MNKINAVPGLDRRASYTLAIAGRLDGEFADWPCPVSIGRLTVTGDPPITTLAGIITDQAGLLGLIRYLHGLGIVLLAVQRCAQHSNPEECDDRN